MSHCTAIGNLSHANFVSGLFCFSAWSLTSCALDAGVWRTFSGNEVGILLAHWLWCCWRRDHLDDDPACLVMLASAVSSKMLQAMAQVCCTLSCTITLYPCVVCACPLRCMCIFESAFCVPQQAGCSAVPFANAL